MSFFSDSTKFSDIKQDGFNNTQHFGDVYCLTAPMTQHKRLSIIQEVLRGVVDLDTDIEVTELDVKSFSIEEKIDYNEIVTYKEAYEIYMEDRVLIDQRLNFLEKNENALAGKKLYGFIKRIYAKHCSLEDPDMRIQCMCHEIKSDLSVHPDMNTDEIALIPAIIFYVFTKCHIFKKPPVEI